MKINITLTLLALTLAVCLIAEAVRLFRRKVNGPDLFAAYICGALVDLSLLAFLWDNTPLSVVLGCLALFAGLLAAADWIIEHDTDEIL